MKSKKSGQAAGGKQVATKPQTVTLAFERKLVRPDEPPVPCNFAVLARVATDTVMELGFFDTVDMANKLEVRKATDMDPIPTTIFVTHRFILNPNALKMLKEGVDRILEGFKQGGPLDLS